MAIAEDPDLPGPAAKLLDSTVDYLPQLTGFLGPGVEKTLAASCRSRSWPALCGPSA